MIKLKFILLSCFILIYHIGFSNSHTYKIKCAGINIGTLNASHTKVNNFDYYSVVSHVSLKFIVNINVYYKTTSIYKGNKLIESKVNSFVNGRKYVSTTVWNGTKYLIECNAYKYNFVDSSRTKEINWSVSKLYFDKPTEGAEVYAETYGLISQILSEEKNEFLFQIPNSKQIYFYSKQGELTGVEMINSIKNFNVVRIN